MPGLNLDFGKAGENIAVSELKKNGYEILFKNYRTRLGEIDIIAKDKETYAFIEVKTRSSRDFGTPCEAIQRNKQRQMSKVALTFLKENKLLAKKARFDCVSIVQSAAAGIELKIIKNAFELDSRFTY